MEKQVDQLAARLWHRPLTSSSSLSSSSGDGLWPRLKRLAIAAISFMAALLPPANSADPTYAATKPAPDISFQTTLYGANVYAPVDQIDQNG